MNHLLGRWFTWNAKSSFLQTNHNINSKMSATNMLSTLGIKSSANCEVSELFPLTLSMLGNIFCRRHFEIFLFYFSQKIGYDISCKLSLWRQSVWNIKAYFLWILKKNINNLSSAEIVKKMVRVKVYPLHHHTWCYIWAVLWWLTLGTRHLITGHGIYGYYMRCQPLSSSSTGSQFEVVDFLL